MSSPETEKHCTVIIYYDKGVPPTQEELAKRLESKKDNVKADALQELILLMINGESYPKMLMTIIRFVVISNDHRLKRLLMIYWEVVDKCNENGALKEEMILVCNALRSDLLHANEYVRGSTLRLLCKMKYYAILEPLREAVLRNLSHRHSYVRRNAVMCVYSMIKSFGVEVMPDAPDEVEQLLLVEGDLSTKRNAFLMLLNCDQDKAIKYVLSVQDQVSTMGDIFQLAVLELVRKGCRTSPQHKGRFLRIVLNLTSSSSTAVSYDCASTLVSLSHSPLAIHQATTNYVQLLTEQSDNNVKLIVLDRLAEVQKKHRQAMEGMVMDVFRALSCPSLEVRKKVMEICLSNLITQRNVKDIVGLLKKEVAKTLGYEAQSSEGNTEYRRLLIRALHSITSAFSDQAQSVMFLLMDFLTESDQNTCTEVVMFLRELIATYPDMREPILQRLADNIPDVQQSRVLRGCLWLFGEYCEDGELVESVINGILSALRPLPLEPEEPDKDKKKEAEKKEEKKPTVTMKTVLLKDGTYGTEAVYTQADEDPEAKTVKKTPLRNLLVTGDNLLSAMLAVTLTRLALRAGAALPGSVRNEVLFILANLYKLSRNKDSGEKADGAVRIAQCIRALVAAGAGNPLADGQLAAAKLLQEEWGSGHGRAQLTKVLELAQQNSEYALNNSNDETEDLIIPPDEVVVFRQLREKKAGGFTEVMDDDDISGATGHTMASQAAKDGELFAERLAKVQQMSGLADPVYVEAFLQVHSFDLVLELLMVNRTEDTLTNVLVELSTQGDLKVVDRPTGVTLQPGQQITVHASIKVSSTETGVIFGYVSYERKRGVDKEYGVLNELHVDILDYIERAWIGELAFRTMWSEFEWENKININTSISEVDEFLEHIMRNTNMSIVGRSQPKAKAGDKKKKGRLTAEEAHEMLAEASSIKKLIESSNFVAVNLYAKSIFGEDALANVSIERLPDGKLTGSVRIRSRMQGIALSLGDRITVVQRGSPNCITK